MLYKRIVVPKARQLGLSTAETIWEFDEVLFNKNYTAGIIADTKGSVEQIFRDKIRVLWDNLVPRLKYENGVDGKTNWEVDKNSVNAISFQDTKSSIYVDVGFRGGVLQGLHVSEYGKICAMYPRKAEEIKSGSFETVSKTQGIVVESTAMGADGDFYDMVMQAEQLEKDGKAPNALQWKLLFFPWWIEKSYRIEGNVFMTGDQEKYFKELADRDIILDDEQKNWYVLKENSLKDKMKREYPSYLEEAFMVASGGTYFSKEINLLYKQNRVCSVPYDPKLEVYTAWDLGGAGGGDNTSIWFWQMYGNDIRVIDHRSGNNMSMVEIISNVIKKRDYNYHKYHYGPHDLKVTEYSTGKTRRQTAQENGVEFITLPKIAISDRIDLARDMFVRCLFDREKTKEGLTHLSKYRRVFNETLGDYVDRPHHDRASHSSDAYGYMGQAVNSLQPIDNNNGEFVSSPSRGV